LRPFDAQDADFYFGRDSVVAQAVRRLEEFPLLLVVGPSGSGKSSLVRAGIVPAMARAGHPASVVTPGTDPLAALTTAIAAQYPGGLLVVDQLEEVFAHDSGPGGHPGVPRPPGRSGRGREPGGRHPARRLPRVVGAEPAAVPPGRTRAAAADPVDRGRVAGRDRGTSPAGGPDAGARAGRPAGARRGGCPRRAAAALPRPGRDLGTPRGDRADRGGLPGHRRDPRCGRPVRRAALRVAATTGPRRAAHRPSPPRHPHRRGRPGCRAGADPGVLGIAGGSPAARPARALTTGHHLAGHRHDRPRIARGRLAPAADLARRGHRGPAHPGPPAGHRRHLGHPRAPRRGALPRRPARRRLRMAHPHPPGARPRGG